MFLQRVGIIPKKLKSLENAGLFGCGIAPWQQNGNIIWMIAITKSAIWFEAKSDSAFFLLFFNQPSAGPWTPPPLHRWAAGTGLSHSRSSHRISGSYNATYRSPPGWFRRCDAFRLVACNSQTVNPLGSLSNLSNFYKDYFSNLWKCFILRQPRFLYSFQLILIPG